MSENWNLWVIRNAHGKFFAGFTQGQGDPIWSGVMLGAKTYSRQDAMFEAITISNMENQVECKAVELIWRAW